MSAIAEFFLELILQAIGELFIHISGNGWRRFWRKPEKLEVRAQSALSRADALKWKRLKRKQNKVLQSQQQKKQK